MISGYQAGWVLWIDQTQMGHFIPARIWTVRWRERTVTELEIWGNFCFLLHRFFLSAPSAEAAFNKKQIVAASSLEVFKKGMGATW